MRVDVQKQTRVIVTVKDIVGALRYYGYKLPDGDPVIDAQVNKPGETEQIALEWNETENNKHIEAIPVGE